MRGGVSGRGPRKNAHRIRFNVIRGRGVLFRDRPNRGSRSPPEPRFALQPYDVPRPARRRASETRHAWSAGAPSPFLQAVPASEGGAERGLSLPLYQLPRAGVTGSRQEAALPKNGASTRPKPNAHSVHAQVDR